jgi:hypothetical protein
VGLGRSWRLDPPVRRLALNPAIHALALDTLVDRLAGNDVRPGANEGDRGYNP